MQTYGFFNSENGDRKYNAEMISQYFDGIVGNGVLENCGNGLQVLSANNMNVKVQSGRAFLDCHWYNNSADVLLSVDRSEITYDRIDSVTLKMDINKEVRAITLQIKKGIPANPPLPPTLVNTLTVKEIALADIRVNKLVDSITQANITDTRPSEKCGWVTGLIQQVNTSTLFLQWQAAYQEYFTLSTTEFEVWAAKQRHNYETWTTEQKADYQIWTEKKKLELESFVEEETESFDIWSQAQTTEYETWIKSVKDRFYKWLAVLTEELAVNTSVVKYESSFTTQEDNTERIPIQITQYDNTREDLLEVYINGMRALQGIEYTIEKEEKQILLTNALPANQVLHFVCLKSIASIDTLTTMDYVEELLKEVAYNKECIYYANGKNDNILLSEKVKKMLSIGAGEKEIKVFGKMGVDGFSKDEKIIFDFATEIKDRKVTIDFSCAEIGDIKGNASETIIFSAAENVWLKNLTMKQENINTSSLILIKGGCFCSHISIKLKSTSKNIIGMQGVEAEHCNLEMIQNNSEGNILGFEDIKQCNQCNVQIESTGIATGYRLIGSNRSCNAEVIGFSAIAYFVPLNRIVAMNHCKGIAHCKNTGHASTVEVENSRMTSIMITSCIFPSIEKDGYKQESAILIKGEGGGAKYSIMGNTLFTVTKKHSMTGNNYTEIGNIILI